MNVLPVVNGTLPWFHKEGKSSDEGQLWHCEKRLLHAREPIDQHVNIMIANVDVIG